MWFFYNLSQNFTIFASFCHIVAVQIYIQTVPFTLTYHPLNKSKKNIIHNNFHILINDAETKNIFNAPPLPAFRRDKNLKDHLVKTNLKETPQQPGTFPCQHHLCRTYRHINQTTKTEPIANNEPLQAW